MHSEACAVPRRTQCKKRNADGLEGHEDQPTANIGPRVVGQCIDALRCGAGPHCGAEWPISCMSRNAVPTLENVRYLGNMVWMMSVHVGRVVRLDCMHDMNLSTQ